MVSFAFNTVIPLFQKAFIHFFHCAKWPVAMFDNISMTKMLVSCKIDQLKSTFLS